MTTHRKKTLLRKNSVFQTLITAVQKYVEILYPFHTYTTPRAITTTNYVPSLKNKKKEVMSYQISEKNS